MRELNQSELNNVSGGVLPLAFLGGAAVNGYVSYMNGDSLRGIAASAILGGFGGAAGAMARVTAGAVRAKYTIQAAGLNIGSGTITTGSGQGRSEIADAEKVLEK